jgi:hypothetical protein
MRWKREQEWCVDGDMEGGNRSLFERAVPASVWMDWRNRRKTAVQSVARPVFEYDF